MLNKKDQEQVQLFMNKLGISQAEAMELLAFDKEVNQMSVKEAVGDMPSVSKTQATDGVKKTAPKAAKKGESGYTPNQELALQLLKADGGFMTGKAMSEASEGALNSRGLGSVMKKLIEQGIVEKQAGSPVQYKYIGE